MVFKKLRNIKDLQFIVSAELAYTFIILGMVHTTGIAGALIAFRRLDVLSGFTYNDEGLVDAGLIIILFGLFYLNVLITIIGVYFLKHLEPTHKKREHEFDKKTDSDIY